MYGVIPINCDVTFLPLLGMSVTVMMIAFFSLKYNNVQFSIIIQKFLITIFKTSLLEGSLFTIFLSTGF